MVVLAEAGASSVGKGGRGRRGFVSPAGICFGPCLARCLVARPASVSRHRQRRVSRHIVVVDGACVILFAVVVSSSLYCCCVCARRGVLVGAALAGCSSGCVRVVFVPVRASFRRLFALPLPHAPPPPPHSKQKHAHTNTTHQSGRPLPPPRAGSSATAAGRSTGRSSRRRCAAASSTASCPPTCPSVLAAPALLLRTLLAMLLAPSSVHRCVRWLLYGCVVRLRVVGAFVTCARVRVVRACSTCWCACVQNSSCCSACDHLTDTLRCSLPLRSLQTVDRPVPIRDLFAEPEKEVRVRPIILLFSSCGPPHPPPPPFARHARSARLQPPSTHRRSCERDSRTVHSLQVRWKAFQVS